MDRGIARGILAFTSSLAGEVDAEACRRIGWGVGARGLRVSSAEVSKGVVVEGFNLRGAVG
jgi:hypothetical protein